MATPGLQQVCDISRRLTRARNGYQSLSLAQTFVVHVESVFVDTEILQYTQQASGVTVPSAALIKNPGPLLAAQELHLGEVDADFLQVLAIAIVLRSSGTRADISCTGLCRNVSTFICGTVKATSIDCLSPRTIPRRTQLANTAVGLWVGHGEIVDASGRWSERADSE